MTLEPIVEQKREMRLFINDPLQPGEEMEPDDVRLISNNKSIKNIQIRPDKYAVVIEKAGYHPKEIEIHIPENGLVREKVTLDYKRRGRQIFDR